MGTPGSRAYVLTLNLLGFSFTVGIEASKVKFSETAHSSRCFRCSKSNLKILKVSDHTLHRYHWISSTVHCAWWIMSFITDDCSTLDDITECTSYRLSRLYTGAFGDGIRWTQFCKSFKHSSRGFSTSPSQWSLPASSAMEEALPCERVSLSTFDFDEFSLLSLESFWKLKICRSCHSLHSERKWPTVAYRLTGLRCLARQTGSLGNGRTETSLRFVLFRFLCPHQIRNCSICNCLSFAPIRPCNIWSESSFWEWRKFLKVHLYFPFHIVG